MDIYFNVIKPFEKWYALPKRLKIAYGGRGGAKSECIARMLIAKSFEKSATILCAREIQKSISYSTYPLLINVIKSMGLEDYFSVTKSEIVNKVTGSNFIFLGLRECSIDTVKSIYNVWICFIEEGQTITRRSLEILEPSIRAKDSEIWWAFNPRFSTDIIYKITSMFELEDNSYTDKNGVEYKYRECEKEDILILFLNYYSNCFFSGVLEKSRRMTLELMPKLYSHIWLGEIKKEQGKIFLYNKLKFYDETKSDFLDLYPKKAIVDPAFGETNCFTSVLLYSEAGRDLYLIDSGLMRAGGDNTTDEIITEFLFKNGVKEVMCEANFSQKELVKKLRRNFSVRSFYVRVNKIDRIVNASFVIYERVFFPLSWTIAPKEYDTEKWIEVKEGRGFIALQQLLNFSDIESENCVKGDNFSFVDFPDVLSSLVTYGAKSQKKLSYKEGGFNYGMDRESGDKDLNNKIRRAKTGVLYGINA